MREMREGGRERKRRKGAHKIMKEWCSLLKDILMKIFKA